MVDIFICEDEAVIREGIKKILIDYIFIEELDMRVRFSTGNPHEMLAYINSNKIVGGLFFLDIDLKTDIDGIELAEQIRKRDKRAMITMVTSVDDAMSLTFKHHIEAVDVITKGDEGAVTASVLKCIELAKERLYEDKNTRFKFRINNKIVAERHEDILYFTKSNEKEKKNKVVLITKTGSFEFKGSLKNLALELEGLETFVAVGGSHIFNIALIQSFDIETRYVYFEGGLETDIAKSQVKKMLKLLANRTK